MTSSHSNPGIIIFIFSQLLIIFSSADHNELRGTLCDPTSPNSTSTWTANLNTVFASLAPNVNRSHHGYYTDSFGLGSDKAFALIQCRGDLSPSRCYNCTLESLSLARQYCGGSKTGVVWQKWCLLRYSNSSFYGQWEEIGLGTVVNSTVSNNTAAYDGGRNMMAELASAGRMFATSMREGRGWKRYGLAQCTGDMGKKGCGDCLAHFFKAFVDGVQKETAWEIYGVGCIMQYDDRQFYFNDSSLAADDNFSNNANAPNSGLGGRFEVSIIAILTSLVTSSIVVQFHSNI